MQIALHFCLFCCYCISKVFANHFDPKDNAYIPLFLIGFNTDITSYICGRESERIVGEPSAIPCDEARSFLASSIESICRSYSLISISFPDFLIPSTNALAILLVYPYEDT